MAAQQTTQESLARLGKPKIGVRFTKARHWTISSENLIQSRTHFGQLSYYPSIYA